MPTVRTYVYQMNQIKMRVKFQKHLNRIYLFIFHVQWIWSISGFSFGGLDEW